LFGTLNQMGSFLSSSGRNQAGFLFGYQTAGVIVLILSYSTGFGQSPTSSGQTAFYWSVVAISALSFAAFCSMLCFTSTTDEVIQKRDYRLRQSNNAISNAFDDYPTATEPLLAGDSGDQNQEDDTNRESLTLNYDVGLLTFSELFGRTFLCSLCIFVSVSTNIAMTAWFAKVKSPTMMLPQYLFFTRTFADAFGRPASLLVRNTPISMVLMIAILRFCLVPIFFLMSSVDGFPLQGNATALMVLVTVIAFLSGYISTTCYQIAPKLLAESEATSVTKQASLLNIVFGVSALSGVTFSLILQLIS